MHKGIIRDFIKYVSLNVAGTIALSCYILADTFFISRAAGADGLTALNFCLSVFCVMSGLGMMIGMGGATRYSILRSQGEHNRTNNVFTNCIIFGLGISVLFLIIGIFFSRSVSALLGASGHPLELSQTYLTTLLSFSPLFVLNNIMLPFVRNDGNPRLSMIAMITSSIANIVMDYILMFPFDLGMFGAALATGISPIISLCILSMHFVKNKNNFSLCKCRIRINILADVSALGMSSLIGEMASAVTLITFNLIILGIEGNTGVAAYGIVANTALVATAVFNGVAQGIQPLASHAYGAGDRSAVKTTVRYGIITAFILSIVLFISIYVLADPIVLAFNSEADETLEKLAIDGMRIYFAGYIFAGMNIVAASVFSATDKPMISLIVSILRSCVLIIPIVFVLSIVFKMNGVWASFVVTELIVVIISIYFMIKRIFRRSDVE